MQEHRVRQRTAHTAPVRELQATVPATALHHSRREGDHSGGNPRCLPLANSSRREPKKAKRRSQRRRGHRANALKWHHILCKLKQRCLPHWVGAPKDNMLFVNQVASPQRHQRTFGHELYNRRSVEGSVRATQRRRQVRVVTRAQLWRGWESQSI
jgi:hypothetical protein